MKHVVAPPTSLGKMCFPLCRRTHPFGQDREDDQAINGEVGGLAEDRAGGLVIERINRKRSSRWKEGCSSGEGDDWIDVEIAFPTSHPWRVWVRTVVLDEVTECAGR